MRMRRLFLALFALVSSCGPAPEGPPDTVGVAPGPRSEGPEGPVAFAATERPEASPPRAAPTSSIPNVEKDATLVGFAGSRFAIVETRGSTLVFDADTASAFGVYGHPLTLATNGAWDIWANANFTGDVLSSSVITSADGSRMVVQTEGGVQVVDLGNRGKMLTGLRMEDVRGASVAPDGESLAAWNARELTLVRVGDGARVSYPLAASGDREVNLQWSARAAFWTDGASARIVDRATWRLQTTEGSDARLTASKDGSVVVALLPSLVEVWRAGEARPATRVVAKNVANVVVDEPGRYVAWVEYSGEYDAKSDLHTIEVETGAHHSFAGQAKNCQLTHEYLLGIENGELRTDGECSPGCPSLTRQSDFRTYDVKTGKVLKHWMGDVERPFNEGFGARLSMADELSKTFGLPVGDPRPIKHHPSADLVLVERPDALRLVDDRSGAARATLERSADFSVAIAHFWPESGSRIIGVGGGQVVVWDTASGERVWASRR